MFECDKCGSCCMQVDRSILYAELDRGDGVCRFFDDKLKLCAIYETRPLLCNVDDAYSIYFRDKISKDDYYNLNYEMCRKFRGVV